MRKQEIVNGSLAIDTKSHRVITIPATEQPQDVKLRVAAYARVSSSSEDQLNSFSAQNNYYTAMITSNDKWTMVDIYADEGISGTSVEKRDDFQRLLTDCRRGQIDRILVKSISRFARNTKECLETVRELKGLGVSVFFEEQGIDTATMTSEMILSVFASLAQEESRNTSANMRWSYQRRMESGTFLPSSMPYGYELVDSEIRIVESEANVVCRIFSEYLSGKNIMEIVSELNKEKVPRKDTDENGIWHFTTVRYILMNERYIGDSLWQKTYRNNEFPAKGVRNQGERQMYYVEGTHPPIISKNDFQTVQELLRKRAQMHRPIPHERWLDKKIYCGQCGTSFRRKGTSPNINWCCRKHEKNKDTCSVTQISELEIQSAFLCLYYKLKHFGMPILNEMVSNLRAVREHRMLWSMDIIELNKKIADLSRQNQVLADYNQQGLIDPDIFISQSNALTEQLRTAKKEKSRLLDKEEDRTLQRTKELMEILENGPEFLDAFDGELFGELVERIIVESNTCLRFRLINGMELTESIERKLR